MAQVIGEEHVCWLDEGALIVDGFGPALLGISYDGRAIYDYDRCVSLVQHSTGLLRNEAEERFAELVIRIKASGVTPLFVHNVIS